MSGSSFSLILSMVSLFQRDGDKVFICVGYMFLMFHSICGCLFLIYFTAM